MRRYVALGFIAALLACTDESAGDGETTPGPAPGPGSGHGGGAPQPSAKPHSKIVPGGLPKPLLASSTGASIDASCATNNCSGINGGCNCTGACGPHFIEASCKESTRGLDCSCTMDLTEVGSCTQPPGGTEEACKFAGKCCAKYFSP